MRVLKAIGKFIWRFMVIFSFIVNIILVIVLLVAGLLIFDIKNNIAQPLVVGLHSSFVGLDNATIDWTIPVRDNIPVDLDIQLKTDTVVVLNEPVPLVVNATIDLPGINAYGVTARVDLELPAGLELPVALDVPVPVRERLDVAMDVRAVIPLSETQLHDPFENLRLLFEPFGRALYNLPGDFNEAGAMVGDVLAGNWPNLLEENEYSQNPWPGFSKTAGLNYSLLSEPVPVSNLPAETGIVAIGGIPALDEQLRPEVYALGGPEAVNAQAFADLEAKGVPESYFNGDVNQLYLDAQMTAIMAEPQTFNPDTGGSIPMTPVGSDLGIMPTPFPTFTPTGGQ